MMTREWKLRLYEVYVNDWFSSRKYEVLANEEPSSFEEFCDCELKDDEAFCYYNNAATVIGDFWNENNEEE